MSTTYHFSIDIDGALEDHIDVLVGNITVGGKTLNTYDEVKSFLLDCKAKGWQVLPCGECDNFDYQTGCKGHHSDDEIHIERELPFNPKFQEKLKVKHHSPEVYRLYDYLKAHHMGKANGIKKPDLAKILGINKRELRKLTQEINESTELEKLVSTSHCCYMCETEEECKKSIQTTYRSAVTLIKKAKNMERKVGLNGQLKIPLGKYYKEMVETFTDGE